MTENSNETNENESSLELTGKTIGGYHVIRRLGRGGMAEVYLARQESLKRNVALKVLKPELAKDSSYIERFEREAQSAAKLVQANIVGVYEVGEVDGLHYIAQEYILGRNLREYLARNGAVKPVMAVNVLRQVALALQKADEHNVTHRDIKPENIMLSPSGEVKVADFGLARVNDETDKHLTQIGITMGTPLYMSPEQVEGYPADIRSDIYSLGVSAYHMLAGEPPFDGENAMAIAVKHVKDEPESLAAVRPDLPIELVELVEKMMAKSPDARPQTAGALLKAIKAIKLETDQDWDQLVETLAIRSPARETTSLSESRMAITRQLQSVMKGNIRSWWTEFSTLLTFALLLVTGVGGGVFLTKMFPSTDLLGSANNIGNAVDRMDSAKEQYELAINFHGYSGGDRDALLDYYRAVLDYFPLEESSSNSNQTRLYRDRATERMAELLLIAEEYEQAKNIYEQFAVSDYQSRLSIVGNAGLAIIYHKLQQDELARQKITLIESKAEDNLNMFLGRRFEEVRQFYFNPSLGGQTSALPTQ